MKSDEQQDRFLTDSNILNVGFNEALAVRRAKCLVITAGYRFNLESLH